MKPDKAKLRRLQRLEKLRAIAKRNAAAETARAEQTLVQLQSLADRSRTIAESYGGGREITHAAELRALSAFVAGVRTIAESTESDAARARGFADRKLAELAEAERRRGAVEERALHTARQLAKGQQNVPTGPSGRIGTALE